MLDVLLVRSGGNQGEQEGWRYTADADRTGRPRCIAALEEIAACNDEIGEQLRGKVNLVQVVGALEMRAAFADEAGLGHEAPGHLALNGQAPLVNRRVLHIGIEGSDGRRRGARLHRL